MKIHIGSDDGRPLYYTASERHGVECEVPEETVARWKRVEQELESMQQEMEAARRAAFRPVFGMGR